MSKQLPHRLRLFLWLMLLTLVPAQLPARDFAYTYEGNTVNYTVLSEEAKTVSTKKGSYWNVATPGSNVTGVLILPETVQDEEGNTYTLTKIGMNSFPTCDIIGLELPSTLEAIDKYAFQDCKELKSAIIPPGVSTIGTGAFERCEGMRKGAYPSNLDNPFPYNHNIPYDRSIATVENGYLFTGEDKAKTNLLLVNTYISGEIILPETVTTIGDFAFRYCDGVTGVTFDDALTSIGQEAFYGCNALTSVTFGDALTTIGESAFDGCDGLTSVTFGNAPKTTIAYRAFYGCGALTSLTFGDTTEMTIEMDAFKSCDALTSVTFGNGPTTIGEAAFHLSALTSVTFGNGPTTIGDGCFDSNFALASITFGNGPTTIGKRGFGYCKALTSVILPPTVTSCASNAFGYCDGLIKSAYPSNFSNPFSSGRAISYPAEGSVIEDGFIWSEDKSTIYFVPYDFTGEYNIPSTVNTIGENAFASCSGLSEVTIPASVTSIGKSSFAGCDQLASIKAEGEVPATIDSSSFTGIYDTAELTIPDGSILDYLVTDWSLFKNIKGAQSGIAFEEFSDDVFKFRRISDSEVALVKGNYAGMSSVSIPERVVFDDQFKYVTAITDGAFEDCRMSTLVLPKRLATIGNNAFKGCSYLKEVTLPASLSHLGESAFMNCRQLSSATLNENLREIGASAFENCGLETISIPVDCQLGNRAFANCQSLISAEIATSVSDECFSGDKNLTTVTLTDNTATIGESSFADCTSLASLSCNDNLQSIGASAFKGCTSLASATFNDNLQSIGESAFTGCTSLASAAFNDNLQSIGESAFENSALETVSIPAACQLGNRAFANCQSLVSAEIATSVSDECFIGDKSLQTVTLTDNATTIGASAFEDCDAITTLTLNEGLIEIGASAFYRCKKLPAVSIPASVETVGQYAFQGCSELANLRIEDSKNPIQFDGPLFGGSANIKSLYIGRDWTADHSSFSYHNELKSLVVGNLVTAIPDEAFSTNRSLSTVTLGAAVKTIGASAFSGCALTEIVMSPATVTIGDNAFDGNSLKGIAIGANVTEIGENAFNGSNALEGVSITALTPPNASNNTFSYYDCPLYVSDANAVEAYYNFTRCWYRFSGYSMIPADNVEIEGQSTITLKPGETMKFAATVTPADATLPYIFWRSTNPAFATVDNEGNVKMVGGKDGVEAYSDEEEVNECQIIAETLYADGPVAQVTVRTATSGVEDVTEEAAEAATIERPNHIYNLQGVLLKLDATQDDIDALAPGLYIIGGKKVVVK